MYVQCMHVGWLLACCLIEGKSLEYVTLLRASKTNARIVSFVHKIQIQSIRNLTITFQLSQF